MRNYFTKALCILFAAILVLTELCIFVPSDDAYASEDNPLIVMLDPGHGGNDPGVCRTYNNVEYRESDYNLALVNACREELAKYDNVIVYQSRVADNYISTYARAKYAADVGADVFVSFHINSSSATYVSGSSVIVPSGNYRPQLKADATKLAEKILRNLEELGFKYRGFEVRNIENDIYLNYPDGSKADYFEVIRRCVIYDIPSMIVEHAFITNDSDIEKLNDASTIKEMGKATAEAIAAQYGLKKTGKALTQPTLYNQESGITVSNLPSTATVGDVVTPVATGGSGDGEYYYYVNNSYIAKVEDGKIIFIGAGTCKITGGRNGDETHTPRNSTTYQVTVSGVKTELQLEGKAYNNGSGTCSLVLTAKPKTLSGQAVPMGKVTFYDGAAVLGTGTFNEAGECTITVENFEVKNVTVSAKYESVLYDGYTFTNNPTLTLDLVTVTPAPATAIPATEAPTATSNPSQTADAGTSAEPGITEEPGARTPDPDYGKISFKDVITDPDVRMVMIVAAIIICIIIIIIIIGKIRNKDTF